jgi:hypothetical protein
VHADARLPDMYDVAADRFLNCVRYMHPVPQEAGLKAVAKGVPSHPRSPGGVPCCVVPYALWPSLPHPPNRAHDRGGSFAHVPPDVHYAGLDVLLPHLLAAVRDRHILPAGRLDLGLCVCISALISRRRCWAGRGAAVWGGVG